METFDNKSIIAEGHNEQEFQNRLTLVYYNNALIILNLLISKQKLSNIK